MLVRDLMNPHVVTITPAESAALAARLLSRYDLGALPVCQNDGRLKGMVTDRDLVLRCLAPGENPERLPVGDIMTRSCAWVSPNADVREAASVMAAAQVRRLPVVEDRRVVGMDSLRDLGGSGQHLPGRAPGVAPILLCRGRRLQRPPPRPSARNRPYWQSR